jgi:cell division protein FtsW
MFYVGAGTVLLMLGGFLSYHLFNHVRIRFDIWLNPWHDPDGRGYQIIQSLFALGSGGVFGTGLSQGRPNFIPAVHTDFVFAAIGEELGLAGTIAVLLLFMLLIYRGFRAALSAPHDFCALVAAGLSSLLALQTFVIIGGVTKFVPLTGVTLPFISYGGSSMLSNFLILGLLHNISEKR